LSKVRLPMHEGMVSDATYSIPVLTQHATFYDTILYG
jgi:hypothetical protein